jgi:hypothetical protein
MFKITLSHTRNTITITSALVTLFLSKMTVLWDDAPCSLVETGRRFRGAYCFYHEGDEASLKRRQSPPDYTAQRPEKNFHTRRRDNLITHTFPIDPSHVQLDYDSRRTRDYCRTSNTSYTMVERLTDFVRPWAVQEISFVYRRWVWNLKLPRIPFGLTKMCTTFFRIDITKS